MYFLRLDLVYKKNKKKNLQKKKKTTTNQNQTKKHFMHWVWNGSVCLCCFVKSLSEWKTGKSIKWQATENFLYPSNTAGNKLWKIHWLIRSDLIMWHKKITTVSCKIQIPWNKSQIKKSSQSLCSCQSFDFLGHHSSF